MALYHKWNVKNDFAFLLQFFSLISDGIVGVPLDAILSKCKSVQYHKGLVAWGSLVSFCLGPQPFTKRDRLPILLSAVCYCCVAFVLKETRVATIVKGSYMYKTSMYKIPRIYLMAIPVVEFSRE